MSGSRKAVSKRVRFEIFKRDGFVCQYCGAHPPAVALHLDHIEAVANGGSNDIDNLITACESCNLGKGARALTAIPESLASKADRVAEAEAQLAGYNAILRARADRLEDETWRIAEMLWPGSSETGADRRDLMAIKNFISELGVEKVAELAEIGLAKGRSTYQAFKYFCGCCWRTARRNRGEEL